MAFRSGNPTWQDLPSNATPLNATALNALESALTTLGTTVDGLGSSSSAYTITAKTTGWTASSANFGTALATYNSASAGSVTIPSGLSVTGQVCVLAQIGAGALSVVAGSGVTITAPPGYNATLAGTGAVAVLTCIASNTYLLGGNVTQVTNATISRSASAIRSTSGLTLAFSWSGWNGITQGVPVAGLYLLAGISYKGGGTLTPPSGWTLVQNAGTLNSDNDGLAIYQYGPTTGTDTAPTWTNTISDLMSGWMLELQGTNSTLIDVKGGSSDNASTATRSGPSLTPTHAYGLLITTASWAGNGSPPTITSDSTGTLVTAGLSNYLACGVSSYALDTSLSAVSRALTASGPTGSQLDGSQVAVIVRASGA